MKKHLRIAVACGTLFVLHPLGGCEPEGTGTIGPPGGEARKDDAFLIPGYNPNAAKALKKGKAAPPKGEVVQPENPRL